MMKVMKTRKKNQLKKKEEDETKKEKAEVEEVEDEDEDKKTDVDKKKKKKSKKNIPMKKNLINKNQFGHEILKIFQQKNMLNFINN